jgi:transposase
VTKPGRRLSHSFPKVYAGARRKDDRRIISGIVQVLRSGCRWKDCPAIYGPHTTVYNRFNRWSRQISRQKFGTNRKEVQKYVDAFRIACLLSDDLIEGDARYIAEQQQKKYDFEYPEKTLTAGSLVEPWELNDLNVEFSETVASATSGSDQAELNCEVY